MPSTLSGPLLDILIGLVFVYASLSLILSAVGDCLSNALGWRAGMFQAGVDAMLRPTDARRSPLLARLARGLQILVMPNGPIFRSVRSLVDRILRRTPPTAETHENPWSEIEKKDVIATSARALVERFLNHPACQSYVRNKGFFAMFGRGSLSYIPSPLFPKVLLQCLLPVEMRRTVPTTPIDFRRCLDLIQDPSLAELLRTVTEGRNSSIQEIEAALTEHFESVMAEVKGWYARKMSVVTFAMGLVVAVGFNIDTIDFVRKAWADPARSKALADMAAQQSDKLGQVIQKLERLTESKSPAATKTETGTLPSTPPATQPGAGTATPPSASNREVELKKTIEEANLLLEQIKPQLPVGWKLPELGQWNNPKDIINSFFKQVREHLTDWRAQPVRLLMRWLGLIITALAISMQSRFWYDLLQRILKIRREQESPAAT